MLLRAQHMEASCCKFTSASWGRRIAVCRLLPAALRLPVSLCCVGDCACGGERNGVAYISTAPFRSQVPLPVMTGSEVSPRRYCFVTGSV